MATHLFMQLLSIIDGHSEVVNFLLQSKTNTIIKKEVSAESPFFFTHVFSKLAERGSYCKGATIIIVLRKLYTKAG